MTERIDEFMALLESRLKPARFIHSKNVADAAVVLAKQVGADEEKAYICGLLHDCMKNAPLEEQNEWMLKLGDPLPSEVLENPKLWHAPAGAAFVRDELGIVDGDMISAIKYHTTGRAFMTPLEKVIYVADFISAERDYPGVERVRARAYENIDKAVLDGAQFTLQSLLEKYRKINHDTLAMYNEMAEKLGDQMEEK